ncbi:MAG: LacI family DNA-binding transcriptional regulator [Subdoligranulum sp.]
MKDVAAAAGVSVAAVSRVMNGSGYVAPDKREAILQAISTVGYRAQRVPPALDRSLG